MIIFSASRIILRDPLSLCLPLSVVCSIQLPSFLFSLLVKYLTLQQLRLQPTPYLLAGLIKSAMHLSSLVAHK